MTLLASERSLLIRNKFRSVLQLRIQNRRLSEINADPVSNSLMLKKCEIGRLQQNMNIFQNKWCKFIKKTEKKRSEAHLGQLLKIHLFREETTGSASFPADVFEEDISSSISSLIDQPLSDCSAVGLTLNDSPSHAQSGLTLLPPTAGVRQPLSVTLGESNSLAPTGRPNGMFLTAQTTPLLPKFLLVPSTDVGNLTRPRKPRDIKPKMKKLKYHQYIPPDQKSSPAPAQPLDPAYSHLLKQQQVFLQLQILQSQQQQTFYLSRSLCHSSSGDHNDLVKSCGASPLSLQPVPATTNQTQTDANPTSKPEPLPANLVDLTVSELRQQLRKRGLPVSGTKPALLQRLRPFQLQHACPAPAPLSKLGTSMEPFIPCAPLLPCQSPGSSPGFRLSSPGSSPNQQLLAGEQCGLGSTVFLDPASTASGTPSPSLPMSSSSPLQCGTPWRTDREQQQEHLELSVKLEKRERKRSRHTDQSGEGSLHPFLQQDPGCLKRKAELNAQTEVLFAQVICSSHTDIEYVLQNIPILALYNQFDLSHYPPPCDVIGHDFELPLQITASPAQTSPGVRSLEEELQEAIQKAQQQMDPRQSIDDILDEPLICDGESRIGNWKCSLEASDHKSAAHSLPDRSPAPQAEQPQPFQQQDDNFLPSPLCSSLLLELPPSPAVINPSQVVPAPPPLPICTSPSPSTRRSRKRRAPAQFDAADWLETLTSGLHPLTPPKPPFVESDFSLDSDLNVNRVLDLLIEQW
uniref:Si:dkeyp-69b9.3 n=1 Tax=Poecilia formosa TaxID=48698 RepID=A0A096M426_POEFO